MNNCMLQNFYHMCFENMNNQLMFIRQARGSGRLHHYGLRYGYNELILQALRIKLRYPLGSEWADKYIARVIAERDYENNFEKFMEEFCRHG